MRWRWVPPVHSPVSARALAAGAATAAGFSGPRDEQVRQRITSTFGARDVVLTDSGTSALVLALRVVVPRNGTVALPAYACIDLVAAAIGAGVRVRFYDVDPATLSPDLESVRQATARGVDAILVAPLYGYPVDAHGIAAIAAERGIRVIEDAAQSAGGEVGGRRVGSFGNVAILSFGRGKGTTGGSGGALLVHDPELVNACRDVSATLASGGAGWRDVVVLKAQWLLARPAVYALPASIPALKLGEMVYHAPHEPRGVSAAASRMIAFALEGDRAEIEQRRSRAHSILSACTRASNFTPVVPVAGGVPGFLRVAVLDATGNAAPQPRLGVLRSYPITLDQHAATQSVMIASESAGTGARTLRDRLFTLPAHSGASTADVQRVIAWLVASRAR